VTDAVCQKIVGLIEGTLNSPLPEGRQIKKKYSFNEPSITNSFYTIESEPTNFNSNDVDLLEPKKNWFINISNISISNDIAELLQLGEGFCLPTLNKKKT